jgi:hypothetical protein
MFKCPVDYDINNCSSKEYGLTCDTCYHKDDPEFNKIQFENGSVIEYFTSTSNHRGHRSGLVTFYCVNCGIVHEEVPMSEIMCISENFAICKTSFDNAIKPYLADQK